MDKIQLIQKMCNESPKNAELKYLLGIEYKEASMFKESITAFSDALKYAEGDLFERIMKEIAEVGSMKKTETMDSSAARGNTDKEYTSQKHDEIDNFNVNDAIDEDVVDEDVVDEDVVDEDVVDEVGRLRVLKGGHAAGRINQDKKSSSAVTFNDVGGLGDLKNTIKMRIIKPFLTPGLFERFKKKSGGGLLLFGPPGCGKTFLAKATAGECSAIFKPVHITDVLDPYFGQSAQNIKEIFSVARAQKPCVLFFDEIDTIGFNRAKTSTDMMRSVVDQLLSEIEGVDSNTEKILIIGATNMPWDIDPALRRPGRFDRTIFISPPDINAREIIFKLKMEGKPSENIDYKLLARESELFSGADIENVIETATENVLEEILQTGVERNIRQEDLVKALKSIKPSTIEWLRTISNYVKYANQSGIYDEVERYISKHKKYF